MLLGGKPRRATLPRFKTDLAALAGSYGPPTDCRSTDVAAPSRAAMSTQNLPACDSARGGFGGGEGSIGLTWALLLAGSHASIASGWKVDGKMASQLMLELRRA